MTDYEHWALEYKKSADELRMKIDLMEYRRKHHGLTPEGKKNIEDAFRNGLKYKSSKETVNTIIGNHEAFADMPKMKGADENERDQVLFGGCVDGCALGQAMYDARCRKNDIADKVQGLCRSQFRLQK